MYMYPLEMDTTNTGGMWLLDLVVMYPVFLHGLLRFLRWRDGGCRIEHVDTPHHINPPLYNLRTTTYNRSHLSVDYHSIDYRPTSLTSTPRWVADRGR